MKRLAKEKTVYEQEVVKQTEHIEKMKADGKDEYDIKKQTEVLEESKMMIPDCQRKLKDAHAKLSALLEETAELHESKEYSDAKDQAAAVQSIVAN
ncbi:TBCA [Bugula neritina]|uniref:Tubulin-specific chaperone A n=1 Tax=Bugula neritina TaxID=10212 RepID=A0A7J7IVZ5_BUGNE|nr:TBCA [Bugula neritina]